MTGPTPAQRWIVRVWLGCYGNVEATHQRTRRNRDYIKRQLLAFRDRCGCEACATGDTLAIWRAHFRPPRKRPVSPGQQELPAA